MHLDKKKASALTQDFVNIAVYTKKVCKAVEKNQWGNKVDHLQ